MTANLVFAWCWILAGLLSGTAQGLFFHRENWLGGYASWQRRLMRLGHISFFGTALINLLAALSARLWIGQTGSPLLRYASILLIVGAITMPLICYLSAWNKPLRNFFFIPVISLISGVACFLVILLQSTG